MSKQKLERNAYEPLKIYVRGVFRWNYSKFLRYLFVLYELMYSDCSGNDAAPLWKLFFLSSFFILQRWPRGWAIRGVWLTVKPWGFFPSHFNRPGTVLPRALSRLHLSTGEFIAGLIQFLLLSFLRPEDIPYDKLPTTILNRSGSPPDRVHSMDFPSGGSQLLYAGGSGWVGLGYTSVGKGGNCLPLVLFPLHW